MVRHSNTYIKLFAILLLLSVISIYTVFQTRNLIRGPIIILESPENGSTLNTSFIEIKGTAQNISYINLNDQQIFTDENGVFSEKLLLSYGYNIITLRAQDKFGREITKTLELIYK